jgi:DNA-binding CsgD family transcriptional regulator
VKKLLFAVAAAALLSTAALADDAALADTPTASRTAGAQTLYYETVHEAFEAAEGVSIDTPDEITLLADIVLDAPIIIDTAKHIRLIPGSAARTIRRGGANLDYPLFLIKGNASSLTLGKPDMEGELVIDGGYLQTPPVMAHSPLITVNGADSKLIMYDNVTLQNNFNNAGAIVDPFYQNGSGVFLRTLGERQIAEPEHWAEFIMKGGTIRGNTNNIHGAYPYGGGVMITDSGVFTMEGGTIMNNTAASVGGGVYIRNSGTFRKTGGIIYGKNAPPEFRNTAQNGILGSFGHAVYVTLPTASDRYRDDTVDEKDYLTYTGAMTQDGVFGANEKWSRPPQNRNWLIAGLLAAAALGLAAYFIIRKRLKAAAAPEEAEGPQDLGLTPRESEIYNLLLDGLSVKEIAYSLKLTYWGVTFHIRNIYAKAGVQNQRELLLKYGKKQP